MVTAQGVSASGVIDEFSAGIVQVPAFRIERLEVIAWPLLVQVRRVVEHDVQPDFQPCFVDGINHFLKLGSRIAGIGGVGRFGGEKQQR